MDPIRPLEVAAPGEAPLRQNLVQFAPLTLVGQRNIRGPALFMSTMAGSRYGIRVIGAVGVELRLLLGRPIGTSDREVYPGLPCLIQGDLERLPGVFG